VADFVEAFSYNTAGDAIAGALSVVWSTAEQVIPGFLTLIGPAVTNYNGVWAVSVGVTNGTNTTTQFHTAPEQQIGALASPRFVIENPAVTTQLIGGFFNDVTPAQLIAYWKDPYIVAKRDLITSATDGVASVIATPQKTDASGACTYVTSIMQVETRGNYLISQDTLVQMMTADPAITVTPQIPLVVATANVGLGALIGINQIVKALQDIAAQDLDVSINHGQGAASIRGKTAM
jgi:hypothetical protein